MPPAGVLLHTQPPTPEAHSPRAFAILGGLRRLARWVQSDRTPARPVTPTGQDTARDSGRSAMPSTLCSCIAHVQPWPELHVVVEYPDPDCTATHPAARD